MNEYPSNFWVIDCEGNGASPPEIVELALVEVQDFAITGRKRHWLLKPSTPITPVVTRLHGLTNEDVADAPALEDIADEIMQWIENAIIVGHNVRVEIDILRRSFSDWSPVSAIDTLKIAKLLKPGLESYGLQKLGEAMNLTDQATRLSNQKHHSALYDTYLTALIMIGLVAQLSASRRKEILQSADILYQPQRSFL